MRGPGDSRARVGFRDDIEQKGAKCPASGGDRGVPDIGVDAELGAGVRVQWKHTAEAEGGGERREVAKGVGAGQEGSRFTERCHGAMIAPSSGYAVITLSHRRSYRREH
jgi:hypothetical protein